MSFNTWIKATWKKLLNTDDEVFDIEKKELQRQNKGLELIASENYVSRKVRNANKSVFTNKYAEGYPSTIVTNNLLSKNDGVDEYEDITSGRYYGGCRCADELENLAIKRATRLFDCKYANVQPHSGSQANFAALIALRNQIMVGEKQSHKMKVMSLHLNDGGHLTMGSPVSFSGDKNGLFEFCHFPLDSEGRINIQIVKEHLVKNKPDVLMLGYSCYPYSIHYAPYRELCDKYDCKLFVDMAHFSGLVATKFHENPCEYSDIVTLTTHKTLRGPRGGMILTNDLDLYKLVNKAVFPYSQGGPLMHTIAAKAVAFEEASSPKFISYIEQVIDNTKACAGQLKLLGADATVDTDNHLFMLNTKKSFGLTGVSAQEILEKFGITTNKNMLPNDDESPNVTSGLRIGFAALTTRGCTRQKAKYIGKLIYDILSIYNSLSNDYLDEIKGSELQLKVIKLASSLKDINRL